MFVHNRCSKYLLPNWAKAIFVAINACKMHVTRPAKLNQVVLTTSHLALSLLASSRTFFIHFNAYLPLLPGFEKQGGAPCA
jgi:hypothetical protein